jgi:hypothetical protein
VRKTAFEVFGADYFAIKRIDLVTNTIRLFDQDANLFKIKVSGAWTSVNIPEETFLNFKVWSFLTWVWGTTPLWYFNWLLLIFSRGFRLD